MIFEQLFDQKSSTYTYIIASGEGREALIIDVNGAVLSVLILFKLSINFIIEVKSFDKLSAFFSSKEILANFDMCFTVFLSIDIYDYRQISKQNSI